MIRTYRVATAELTCVVPQFHLNANTDAIREYEGSIAKGLVTYLQVFATQQKPERL